jgi:hypothetical protein
LVQGDHEELVEYDLQGDMFVRLRLRTVRQMYYAAYSPRPFVPHHKEGFFYAAKDAVG